MSLQEHTLSAQGSRRLTLTMLAAREQADQFEGLARGTAKPLRFLAAFQEAEPYLGLPPQAFKFIAWLMKMTQPQDWEAGSRPIAWPAAERQEEFLGLSKPRVKALNRLLYEAGVIVMRDSPTGKRYGRRDPEGRIIEAYGFDLSPLAYRYEEFIRLAAEARVERERVQRLRKRVTCARRAIAQIGQALAAIGPLPPEWPQIAAETAELVKAARSVGASDDLTLIVESLEACQNQVEALIKAVSLAMKNDPARLANEPHNISTNKPSNLRNRVAAAEERSLSEPRSPTRSSGHDDERQEAVSFRPLERVEKIHPGELLLLAPRLAAYTPQRFPSWGDIADAAGAGLRRDLGVSQALWGEACATLGRQLAVVALAVVSTKPREHFTRGAGGYFAAMIRRAKTGELNLDRSLWKLRRDRLKHIDAPAAAGARP